MGRRVCMGESMAKDELLVFAVIIMQVRIQFREFEHKMAVFKNIVND